ncbi:hypothetical protein AK812_SmicGene22271 [Symbiodinium microadriaticum]|uniref:Uncharacterized protein n=1 Tax=Symbiodinium microadriaticum TaxID=2951 RepID=A0A1Q9DKB0_SYMMI|nr:hypothetical protein AK812_SmicGene22271 [Symbiodinium microadriaticum]
MVASSLLVAQKASSSEMEVAQPPLSMEATGNPPSELHAVRMLDEAGGTEQVWEDVHEAVLFEMFPEETPVWAPERKPEDGSWKRLQRLNFATLAVEEALLRFAGTPHQAARALEALLARPEAKAMAEGEDDLDYDRASFADEESTVVNSTAKSDGPVDWEDEEEWDEDAEDEWEEEEEEWDEYAEEEQVIPTAEAPEAPDTFGGVPKPVRRWGNQDELIVILMKIDLADVTLLTVGVVPSACNEVSEGAVSCSQESIIDYLASMMGECLQESFVGRVWGKDEVDELHETVVEILQDAENLWQKLKT